MLHVQEKGGSAVKQHRVAQMDRLSSYNEIFAYNTLVGRYLGESVHAAQLLKNTRVDLQANITLCRQEKHNYSLQRHPF